MSQVDIIAFAKWLCKEVKSPKRFVYAKKLTKYGAICVTLALMEISKVFLRHYQEYLENERVLN